MIFGDGKKELEADLDTHLDRAWTQEEADRRSKQEPDLEREEFVDELGETLTESKFIENVDAEFEKENQSGAIRKLASLFSRPRKAE